MAGAASVYTRRLTTSSLSCIERHGCLGMKEKEEQRESEEDGEEESKENEEACTGDTGEDKNSEETCRG